VVDYVLEPAAEFEVHPMRRLAQVSFGCEPGERLHFFSMLARVLDQSDRIVVVVVDVGYTPLVTLDNPLVRFIQAGADSWQHRGSCCIVFDHDHASCWLLRSAVESLQQMMLG